MKTIIFISLFLSFTSCTNDKNNYYVEQNDASVDSDMDTTSDSNDNEQDINWNYNNDNINNETPYPEVIHVSPSGYLRDSTNLRVDFSLPMESACSEGFIVTVNRDGTMVVIDGTKIWENNNTTMIFIPDLPFIQGDVVEATLPSYSCSSRDTNKWLTNGAVIYFEMDKIVCNIKAAVYTGDKDGTILEGENGHDPVVFLGSDRLYAGVYSTGVEVRPIFTVDFTDNMFWVKPENVVAVIIHLCETIPMGIPPQDLGLDVLDYFSQIEPVNYDSTAIQTNIPTTDYPYLTTYDAYDGIYFDATTSIMNMIENNLEGASFRIIANDLLLDGETNIRAFWSSESSQFSIGGPTINICYWDYDHLKN